MLRGPHLLHLDGCAAWAGPHSLGVSSGSDVLFRLAQRHPNHSMGGDPALPVSPTRFRADLEYPAVARRIHLRPPADSVAVTIMDQANGFAIPKPPFDRYKGSSADTETACRPGKAHLGPFGCGRQCKRAWAGFDDQTAFVIVGARYPDETPPQLWLDQVHFSVRCAGWWVTRTIHRAARRIYWKFATWNWAKFGPKASGIPYRILLFPGRSVGSEKSSVQRCGAWIPRFANDPCSTSISLRNRPITVRTPAPDTRGRRISTMFNRFWKILKAKYRVAKDAGSAIRCAAPTRRHRGRSDAKQQHRNTFLLPEVYFPRWARGWLRPLSVPCWKAVD